MPNRTVYMAGQWLPESEAKVSVYDLSVMQAAAAFEMTRSFQGKTFKLDEHLDRLENSCRLLGIPLALSRSALHAVCDEIVDRHRDVFDPADEHRLLIVASPGCAPMYRELSGVIAEPYIYVTDFPLRHTTNGMGRQFSGATAICSNVWQVPNECFPATAKHRSRLAFHLAQDEAKRRGADWAIMTDIWHTMIECPGANIFAVRRGELYAPWFNALRGISREYVLELASQCGVPISSRHDLKMDDLPTMQISEMFVTGTPFCMIPLVQVDGFQIGNGRPGPVYTRLLQAWSESVGVNIAEQIIGWEKA